MTSKQSPVETYKAGNLQVAIWAFDSGKKRFSISKAYMQNGSWRSSKLFSINDITKLCKLLDAVYHKENVAKEE